MNKFEKISKKQFLADFTSPPNSLTVKYEDIKLPIRATKFSAGYDFFAPFDFSLAPGETIKIPTGIRVLLDPDKYLAIVPRSGLGFKFRLQLDNTYGVIDADYSGSQNEGHIWVKITNDTRENKTLFVKKGDGFAQGIISAYYLTDDDMANQVRNGGFGSTTN